MITDSVARWGLYFIGDHIQLHCVIPTSFMHRGWCQSLPDVPHLTSQSQHAISHQSLCPCLRCCRPYPPVHCKYVKPSKDLTLPYLWGDSNHVGYSQHGGLIKLGWSVVCRLMDWRLDRQSVNIMAFVYLWDSITLSAMRSAWSSAVNIEETDGSLWLMVLCLVTAVAPTMFFV